MVGPGVARAWESQRSGGNLLYIWCAVSPTGCLVASPSSAVVKLVTLQGLCPDERIG